MPMNGFSVREEGFCSTFHGLLCREYKGVTAGPVTLLVKPPGAGASGDAVTTRAFVIDYDWGGNTVGLGPISISHEVSEVLPFGWP